MSYVLEESTRGEVEEFKLIYDGTVLMVAALSPLGKIPYGVYDVRDRFIEAVKPVFKLKEVAPCLTHEAIIFVNEGEKIPKDTRNLYIKVNPSATYLDIARALYLRLTLDMHLFYDACATKMKIDKLIFDIYNLESKMISDLDRFLKIGWKKILEKRRLLSQIKETILKILKRLTEYSSHVKNLTKLHQTIEERGTHNKLFKDFVKQVNLDEYCRPQETLSIETSMRIIEHVCKELEVYSVSASTIISALLGAVIGSILTIIVSYSLGLLPL